MRNIWIIANREFKTFFDSLVAYVLLIVFLGVTGFFTWLYGNDIFLIGRATLMVFFDWAAILFVIFIPALTMRTLAEEQRTGTLEVLLTRAVTDWQVVAGKYLATMMLVGLALLFTLPYYFTISWLGDADHGATICGYLGLILIASAFTGIGIFASSLTNDQIVAFLLGLIISVFFMLLIGLLADVSSGWMAQALNYMSFRTHFGSIARGVIDSRDLIYLLSFSALGLILAEARLAKRNLVD